MTSKNFYIEKMKAQLDELKASSEDTWKAMATEMDKVREAFVHSFHYFKSQV